MRRKHNRFYSCYCLLFCITALFVFSPFWMNGKSFVFGDISGGGDGITQHFTALAYYGQYLRTILHNIFINHSFEIPMWDMSIGYGADITSTLSYYVLGDPFTLLSVFCPMDQTEVLYCMLTILRFFCAGLAFSAYCRYMGCPDFSTLVGALVYIFCGYTVYAPLTHPYFMNPMIWYPLLLLGVEKIFHGKKPYLYIVTLAISAVSNFYFFYMMCLLVVIYAIFRYFMLIKEANIKSMIHWLGKFVGYSLLGVGLSMPILLPGLMSVLSQNRVNLQRTIPLFYSMGYYRDFLSSYITATLNGVYSYMGYAIIALFAIALLFLQKKKDGLWKIYFLLLTAMLCIPYAGHVFNGLGYVTNRWIWAYCFIIAFITAWKLPLFFSLDKKQILKLTMCCLIFGVLLYICSHPLRGRIKLVCMFVLCYLLIAILVEHKVLVLKYAQICVMGLLIFNVATNAYFAYSSVHGNELSKYQKTGTAWNDATINSANYILKDYHDTSAYRYDTAAISVAQLPRNSAMLNRLQGTSFYFSTTNNNISQFYEELYINNPIEFTFENLDNRSALDALVDVKYFIVPTGGELYLPPGYDVAEQKDEPYSLYSMDKSLGMAYQYDAAISRETYETLTVTEKQQAILEGVVLDKASTSLPCLPKLEFTDKILPYQVICHGKIEYGKNHIQVNEDNASITLQFAGLPESETYVITKNLRFEGLNQSNLGFWDKPRSTYIQVTDGAVWKAVGLRTPEDNYYSGRHNFLCNMGYRQQGISSITLTFPIQGQYTMDALEVVCQPVQNLEHAETKLWSDSAGITFTSLESNRYNCKTNGKENPGFLCFSIPYSKGWSAQLDGNPVPVLRANTMFMGVELPPGQHEVIISYETPYFKMGVTLAFISLVIIIVRIIFLRRVYR